MKIRDFCAISKNPANGKIGDFLKTKDLVENPGISGISQKTKSRKSKKNLRKSRYFLYFEKNPGIRDPRKISSQIASQADSIRPNNCPGPTWEDLKPWLVSLLLNIS